MDWVLGELATIPVAWLRREVAVPVNTEKELLSVTLHASAVADGSGYWDYFQVLYDLTAEKLTGSDVVYIPLPAINAGTDDERVIFGAVKRCEIVAAHLVPESSLTGDDTNYVQLRLLRKSDDAIICTKTFVTGIDAPAWEVTDFGGVDPDNALLEIGDSVSLDIVHTAGGLFVDRYVLILQWNLA